MTSCLVSRQRAQQFNGVYLKKLTDNFFQIFFIATSWVALSIKNIKTRASREMISRKIIKISIVMGLKSLDSIPPTQHALFQHAKRALLAALWRQSLSKIPKIPKQLPQNKVFFMKLVVENYIAIFAMPVAASFICDILHHHALLS